jgi:hypothetical protein
VDYNNTILANCIRISPWNSAVTYSKICILGSLTVLCMQFTILLKYEGHVTPLITNNYSTHLLRGTMATPLLLCPPRSKPKDSQ